MLFSRLSLIKLVKKKWLIIVVACCLIFLLPSFGEPYGKSKCVDLLISKSDLENYHFDSSSNTSQHGNWVDYTCSYASTTLLAHIIREIDGWSGFIIKTIK